MRLPTPHLIFQQSTRQSNQQTIPEIVSLRISIRLPITNEKGWIDQGPTDRLGLHIRKATPSIEGMGPLFVETDV